MSSGRVGLVTPPVGCVLVALLMIVLDWLGVLTITLAAATCAGTGLSAASDLVTGATYTVLERPTPAGCRVVLRESSFLMSADGQAYEVEPLGIGHRVASWQVDDGYRPISHGTYELSWSRDRGSLHVDGAPQDPVVSGAGPHELSC
ncbi:hypothetical protein GCM10011492_08570 [Flexivirga endophytica]|uniref:Uncharacterized protein n=1 Tax=Flexivirga endophytica TaxID=1849103 RepID=A0A916WQH3_9MICO|nr:hypothetical protein GCM10011492_08570 [Flexivirga endophytica]GHB58720.1 hypothetical protein GCM10008112_29590 [Flexivirga endophytica]